MRVGILTFHAAQNYGAYLQCYSLSEKLKALFPEHVIEVVDYSSANLVNEYKKGTFKKIFSASGSMKSSPVLVTKRLIKSLLNTKKNRQSAKDNKKRKENFESVLDYLSLSADKLVSDNAEEFANFLNGKYDVLIVGSDAIWNDNQTSKINVYLLHDIKKCVKLSYAASTYGMDFSDKTPADINYVNESLTDFRFVGTRDIVTEEYVAKCTNGSVNTIHTCDPSVFLDIDKLPVDLQKLKQKLINHGVDFTKPVIGLMCSEWLAKKVRTNLGETYQYVSVYTRNGYEDVFLDDLTPFEWARVFLFFDATFTHYFHGTMFSLKNGTPTFSVEKKSSYKNKYQTKIQDVLTRLKLYDECYYEIENMDRTLWTEISKKIREVNRKDVYCKYSKALAEESKTFDFFELCLREVLQ